MIKTIFSLFYDEEEDSWMSKEAIKLLKLLSWITGGLICYVALHVFLVLLALVLKAYLTIHGVEIPEGHYLNK